MMNIDKRLISFSFDKRYTYLISIIAGCGSAFFLIMQAKDISAIVAGVFIGDMTGDQLTRVFISLSIIIILRAILTFISKSLAVKASTHILINVRDKLIHHYLNLSPEQIRHHDSVFHVNILIDAIDELESYFSEYLPQLIYAVAIPLLIVIFIFPVDYITALIFLFTAPLIPVFMLLIGQQGEALNKKQWVALNRLSSQFLDVLQGLTTLKALNQSIRQQKKIKESSEEYRLMTMRVLRVTFLSAFVLEFIATIGVAIVAVNIGLRLLYSQMNFQDAFFILLIAPDYYAPLRLLGLKFHAGLSAVTAAEKINSILDIPTEPVPVSNPENWTEELLNEKTIHIGFRDVSFRYSNRNQDAVENIHFDLLPGEITALVGESGSGKTTIANLLLKLILPVKGEIEVNGIPLEKIPTHLWRRNIGWVSQKPHLFNASIEENIRMGNHNVCHEQIVEAARQANIQMFIEQLSEGYQTNIGEDGARLSRGQAQRLALARIFLKNPALVILDEPMSNLDTQNELFLRESIRTLCQGRTLMIIAHTIPTVMHADKIIVLHQGKIAEMGTHTVLQQVDGIYSNLITMHSTLS